MCVHLCVCMYRCVCTWRPEVKTRKFPHSLTEPGAHRFSLARLLAGSKLQTSSCPYIPNPRHTEAGLPLYPAFMWAGDLSSDPHAQSLLTELPPQPAVSSTMIKYTWFAILTF